MVVGAVKIAGQLVIGWGVGALTTAAVKCVTPSNVAKLTKVAIALGGACVAGVAADAASKRFNKQVDTVVAMAKIIKEKMKESEKVEVKEKEAE